MRLLILSIFAAALCSGCFGGDAKQEFFYQLRGPTGLLRPAKGPKVLLANFNAAAGYDSQRLAFRSSAHEIGFYAYHKWTAEPAQLLAETIGAHMRASGRFSAVGGGQELREPDVVLHGTVEAIEEIDLGETWKTRLAMRLALRKAHSDEILVEYAFDTTVPCKEQHPRAVARGVDAIVKKQAAILTERIAEALNLGPAPGTQADTDKDQDDTAAPKTDEKTPEASDDKDTPDKADQ